MFFNTGDHVLAKWVKDDDWCVARILSVDPSYSSYQVEFVGHDGEYTARPEQLVQLAPLENGEPGEEIYAYFTKNKQWKPTKIMSKAQSPKGYYNVKIDGFDKEFHMNPCMLKRPFEEDQHVLALWNQYDRFIPAQIMSLEGDKYANVVFEGRDKEFRVHVRQIVEMPEFEIGERVQALWLQHRKCYPATIAGYNEEDGKYVVQFDDFSKTFDMHGNKIHKSFYD